MKSVTINYLQTNLSKIVREVSKGDVVQVMRYSEPLAYLISKKEYDDLKNGENCRACMQDLRKIKEKLGE